MKKKQYDFLREAGRTIMKSDREKRELDEPVDGLMKYLELSIIKITKEYGVVKYEHLFEGIPNYEDANLLAQFAMCQKGDDELIAIFPGWNKSIDKNYKKDFEAALVLAQQYKYIKPEEMKNGVQQPKYY